jgi:phosphoenolpyruvate-protein phosphotransferase
MRGMSDPTPPPGSPAPTSGGARDPVPGSPPTQAPGAQPASPSPSSPSPSSSSPSPSSDPATSPTAVPAAVERPSGGTILRGTAVAPGLALGYVHRKDHELSNAALERIPRERIEDELNRFHQALLDARAQLSSLKTKLSGRVPKDDARILDVHIAYLKDSVFISDVENLILNEQLALEAAIAKVIGDFDRIFKLVSSEALRERAVDLRDVGIRVLRHLERNRVEPAVAPARPTDYVLAAKELSIVDMFDLQGEHVLGILTEAGALTSHAAILARSMRIPTLTAVHGLLDTIREGDFVIVDASEGIARVNPDEVVRAQYKDVAPAAPREVGSEGNAAEARTYDGIPIRVSASCGNLPEVEAAVAWRVASVAPYRTELLFLVDKEPPSIEALAQHYAAVIAAARGASVTFRLLHADSSLGLGFLHPGRELNPALGRAGVRALLSRDVVLRRQLQALLRAGRGAQARIVVPFVTDTGEVRRVKEVLFEEKLELKKRGEPFLDRLQLGIVVETPAALLAARDLARETDFLLVGLDGLTQYLLAADRENLELRGWFESLHPCVLRALRTLVEVADELHKPLGVFGVLATQAHNLPFLVGIGLRNFCVDPAHMREFLAEVGHISTRSAQRTAQAAAASSCQAETLSLVDGFRHGYARS